MAIVIGFIPTAEGRAALQRAAQEAHQRRTKLVVVSTHDAGQQRDRAAVARLTAELEEARRRLDEAGLEHEGRTFDRGRLR